MARFDLLFPTFIGKCAELHMLLRPVSFALMVIGTILLVRHRFSSRALLMHLVRLLVLVALLIQLPVWGNALQTAVADGIVKGLGVEPDKVFVEYNRLVVAKRDLGTGSAWWDLLGHLSGASVEAVVSGGLWLVGQVASLFLFWAYVFQKVILLVAYALAPIPIGFLAIPTLRSIGGKFLLNLTGVVFWPLGWAVAALITEGIIDYLTDPSIKFLDPTGVGYRLQTLLGLGAIGCWILFSTVAGPLFIQKLFSAGSLVGGELISHAFGGLLSTATTAAGAGAAASALGRPAVTAATVGMAAGLSTLSTAAGLGSAGAILIAGNSNLPARRSARGLPGDDITGDRTVRDLIARQRSRNT